LSVHPRPPPRHDVDRRSAAAGLALLAADQLVQLFQVALRPGPALAVVAVTVQPRRRDGRQCLHGGVSRRVQVFQVGHDGSTRMTSGGDSEAMTPDSFFAASMADSTPSASTTTGGRPGQVTRHWPAPDGAWADASSRCLLMLVSLPLRFCGPLLL